MTRCPAHGNRIQLNPSGAVNLFGATRPLNQIVVGHVDQLQAVPQAKGAQQRVAVGSWRGGGSTGGHRPCQLFWSGLLGKQVTQAGGLGFFSGSAEEPCVVSTLPRIDDTQQVSISTRNDFGF
jgi:hypothetical protein